MLGKLKSLFTKKTVIPSYEVKREIIDSYRRKFNINCFIETGTFLGDTVDFFKDKFQTVYSIELSDDLAQRAKQRFNDQPNVKIIQGNSGEVLKSLIRGFTRPGLFWLDGHYSSEFFFNDEYIVTAKGAKNTPIEQELDILLESGQMHVILIDDARLFNDTNDYPSIKKIKQKILEKNSKYSVSISKDIIRIVPTI